MQAITIAIGKAGINFFASQYLADSLIQHLKQLAPPDKNLTPPNITNNLDTYDNISIALSNGQLQGFVPAMGTPTQQSGGNFLIPLTAPAFTAVYNWAEQYMYTFCYLYFGAVQCNDPKQEKNQFVYSQPMTGLLTQITVQFSFDANAWDIKVANTSSSATPGPPSIPANSVLQYQDSTKCGFSSHVDDATAQAIAAINFASLIAGLFQGVIASIPDSGKLANGVVYDFSVGDSGLVFPNNDGIQMGVKGGASYNGTAFSETPTPSLPLPAPPADNDTHHLDMYVSNYEVDALYWAFYKAGSLNLVINPADLPNPAALAVSSYAGWEPALTPYQAFVMQAQVSQNNAPTTSFQTTYVYDAQTMTYLSKHLPPVVMNSLGALPLKAYVTLEDLENFLKQASIDSQYFIPIANAGQTAALVMTQDIDFNLVIQNSQPDPPYIKFNLNRVDVMTNLQLGLSSITLDTPGGKPAQTLQFDFLNASNTPTFVSSSVPGFQGQIDFAGPLWLATGEGLYASNMQKLGGVGVPLPIMQGFQFDFTNAEISVQEGYVSILANVLYNS